MRLFLIVLVGFCATSWFRSAYADGPVDTSHLQSLDDLDGTAPGTGSVDKVSAQASSQTPKATGRLTGTLPVAGATDWAVMGGVLANTPLTSSSNVKPDIGSVSNLTAGVNARLDGAVLYWPQFPTLNTTIQDMDCDAYVKLVFGSNFFWTPPSPPPSSDTPYFVQGYVDKGQQCYQLMATPPLVLKTVKNLNTEIDAYNKKHANDAGYSPIAHVLLNPDYIQIGQVAQKGLVTNNETSWKTAQAFGLSLLGNEQDFSYATKTAPWSGPLLNRT